MTATLIESEAAGPKPADTGGGLQDYRRARDHHGAHVDALHQHRTVLHAASGNIPGGLEPGGDQRQPGGELGIANMDPGARSCPDFRLDWNIHSGDRILLASQVAPRPAFCHVGDMDHLGTLDFRRYRAVAGQRLSVALARAVAGFRGARTRRLRDLLSHHFRPPPPGLRQGEAGRVDIRGDRRVNRSVACASGQLRRDDFPRLLGEVTGTAGRLRPKLSGPSNLGVSWCRLFGGSAPNGFPSFSDCVR